MSLKRINKCEISGSHRGSVEDSSLLGRYETSKDEELRHFDRSQGLTLKIQGHTIYRRRKLITRLHLL